jgi:hypothetical protein
MPHFKFTSSFKLALLLCGILSRIEAQTNTPITVKDGSIQLTAEGLDAGTNWKSTAAELRHANPNGVITSVQITENGADRCNGDPKCSIDTTKPWSIVLNYDLRTVTLSSISANKGLHVRFSPKIPFTGWKKNGTDTREYGEGDGHHISSIKVNGQHTSLCAGKGGCTVTVIYTFRT